jgi:hypothetical protein
MGGFINSLCYPSQTRLGVHLYACMWDMFGSNLGRDTGYSDWDTCGFPQSLDANVGIVFRLGHDHYFASRINF